MPKLSINCLTLALLWLMTTPAHSAEPTIDFNRQIRPLLSDNCFSCHGPDEKTRKADLRMDTKAGLFATTSEGHAVVPGQSKKSEIVARMLAHDGKALMPPAKSGKKLSPEQIKLVETWIDQGANWSAHWAFITPQRPDLPPVQNMAWAINPIDRFILARLEAEKISPSSPARKETLIRRVSLDLTGLPPTPEQVDAFLKDTSPQAYERVVDRLLASPAYGERMAMNWLDGARYADSNGYQADFERYMWRWRDWVLKSFNDNMPYDRFTQEQLAGDLMPNATLDQKIATGFHRNHRINTEGGIIAEEWRVETVIDRVETTYAVWLGLTMGCARCHDHKYDPISQREFYQSFAFFNHIAESGIGAERPVNHPPLISAPSPADTAKLAAFEQSIQTAEAKTKALEAQLPAQLAEWEKTALAKNVGPTWKIITPTKVEARSKATWTTLPDQSLQVSDTPAGTDAYTLTFDSPFKRITGIRIEVLPDETHPQKWLSRSVNGNFVLTDLRLESMGKAIAFGEAKADFEQASYPLKNAFNGDAKSGWAIHPQTAQAHTATFALATPVMLGDNVSLTLKLAFEGEFDKHRFTRFRVSATDAATPHSDKGLSPSLVAALKTPTEKRSAAQTAELLAYVRKHYAGELTMADAALAALRKERDAFQATIPTVMILAEMPNPRDTFMLIRGQYDARGDKVTAGLPSALPPLPTGASANRLGLAQWITRPDHPLTSRVAVNRFWEKFFGEGLVKTTENFGLQGDPPSHPELLDWLATEFVANGWDMKAMQKTIVMSQTYQQSSVTTPEMLERDPDNRLYARGPRFRLAAELVRDNALAISGLLVQKVGGPSVRPYQPKGVWDETNFYGNLLNYKHDSGDGLYRRSMYTIWKRTAAPPTMLLFDSSTREVCTVRRSRTNTPLQALSLLNEVTYLEASRVLAERMMKAGTTPVERLSYGFRCATARQPSEAELKLLLGGFERRLAKLREQPAAATQLIKVGERPVDATLDAVELAAYTVSASIILNLDETITKE